MCDNDHWQTGLEAGLDTDDEDELQLLQMPPPCDDSAVTVMRKGAQKRKRSEEAEVEVQPRPKRGARRDPEKALAPPRGRGFSLCRCVEHVPLLGSVVFFSK